MACWCEGKCPNIAAPGTMLKAGNIARAALVLRTALTAAPYCPEANLMLAGILGRGNRAQAAELHIDRAAKFGAPGRIAHERAAIMRHQAKTNEAAAAFHDALAADPENPAIWAGVIDTVEVSGELAEAKRLADGARYKFPENGLVRRAAAIVAASLGDHAGAIEILSSPGDELAPIEYLDRGRSRDKIGDHAGAWADWMEGKRLTREKLNHHYKPEYFDRHFSELRAAASPPRSDFYRHAPPVTDSGPTPLFICGFPRSGTTLLETILSAHSGVMAGDELMGVTDAIQALPEWCRVRARYPAALVALSLGENADIPELLRDLYLLGSRRRIGWQKKPGRAAPKYFTDKMPLNEIHLPLIRLLFPTAPIFRMVRHPLDVMVSCMSQWLAHGGFYASSLESCARHYMAVHKLMASYTKIRPWGELGGFRPVNYENLISDQNGVTGALLEIAGLKFEKATLAPHKNKRTARTLSYNQVRQPISAASVGRWKPYREQLAPAVEILRPLLESDGYDF